MTCSVCGCMWCVGPRQILGVHAFDATRKRMSMVLRGPDGQTTLYIKGADNVYDALACSSFPLLMQTPLWPLLSLPIACPRWDAPRPLSSSSHLSLLVSLSVVGLVAGSMAVIGRAPLAQFPPCRCAVRTCVVDELVAFTCIVVQHPGASAEGHPE